MTDVVTVQEGQVWTNGSRNWIVQSISGADDRIHIEQENDGYVAPYRSRYLLEQSNWVLIEDPNDPNLSEFVVQRCSECNEVQGVVSREDIRNRSARRSIVCSDCDLVDPYDEDEDEYYGDDE